MALEEVLKSLYCKKRFESLTNLNEIRERLEHFGNPDKAYPTVHIAGSNGKGQVALCIAKALEASGYKVGLFTSPHLFEFEERIMVNGIPIPKEKVVSLFALLEPLPLIFFELVTLMALLHFRDEKVDVAIIEAGIGGELDTTNVITPILSVITSISLEHTQRLGKTLEEIAAHKAGIIKPHTPVVLGVNVVQSIFFEKAQKLHADVYKVEGKEPFYQLENRKCAAMALSVLSHHFKLTKEAIDQGLKATPKCRFEQRGEWIFDVAHNPEGFFRLAQALDYHFPQEQFRFILGMGKEKDIETCLRYIEPYITQIHFVCDQRPESASTDELASIFRAISDRPYTQENSNKKIACSTSEKVVVCGSFYIMNYLYTDNYNKNLKIKSVKFH